MAAQGHPCYVVHCKTMKHCTSFLLSTVAVRNKFRRLLFHRLNKGTTTKQPGAGLTFFLLSLFVVVCLFG